jgi:hypothetical protein
LYRYNVGDGVVEVTQLVSNFGPVRLARKCHDVSMEWE